ncbi:hypothetical protein N8679_02260 [Candidatus Pelagibacter sp.]|nr:hypothetical protein [Candidatus Pelagibacter sp.]
MFPDNNWYGHRYIILQYLKKKDKEIFASLQHGWISQYLKKQNYKKKNYPILCWSKKNKLFYTTKNIKNVNSIGSPFLYLCKMMEEKKYKLNKPPPKGTMVFPTHSSQDLEHFTNHEQLINDVQSDFEGPYTVCFYYYDLNKKDIDLYKKKNWKVVCCVRGKADKLSLFRLYREISKNEYIISGEFSSALFYGMYLRKKTRVYFNSNKRYLSYTKEELEMVELYKKNYPELFSRYLSPEKGKILGDLELGFESIKDKEQLVKLLGCNSIIKNFFSKILSKLYDLKYGSGLRRGIDLSKDELLKYISVARSSD